MALRTAILVTAALTWTVGLAQERPGPIEQGYLLPNGWRITPVGKAVLTEDLLLNITASPDGRSVVAVTCGYNPHGLVVLDAATDEAVQRIPLPTAWFGMAWHKDGSRLYVSGGNSRKGPAPIYVFEYRAGRLSAAPIATFTDTHAPEETFWAGLVHHSVKPLLYAANRTANRVTVFNSSNGSPVSFVETELNPCDLVLSRDGTALYCSNWGSDSVTVIDTASLRVSGTIAVGDNPTDMEMGPDGRLYVCCANDNTVVVIDTTKGRAVQNIVTSPYPRAPEGSTPNALSLDPDGKRLYVANADNNNVCVVDIGDAEASTVLGFIPAGWYPSAVEVGPDNEKLYIGNGKGLGSYATPNGPSGPIPADAVGIESVKSLQKGAVTITPVSDIRRRLRKLTEQALANSPYNDDLLATARESSAGPSMVPRRVGAGSAAKHVIYILKENRTYDQVLGDLPKGDGDPRLCLFGRDVTPNHHALAEQFVLFDNLYCDAEVSWDGHQWSNAAYATDYTEKYWPADYGGKSSAPLSPAVRPGAGYIWDQCARKGLTYRSYGEFAERVSDDDDMKPAHADLAALYGHVAPRYLAWGARDVENAAEFIREFDEYERNYDSTDPETRLPNFIVMTLPEDHTHGATPGRPTPRACVASNDYALGLIVERVSRSRYWPQLAVFVIEDDAQDAPDHVDARRTVGFALSPYTRRGIVDSTLYTTCSVLRTIELLLGLPPMSQYDAAATPMYAALGDKPNLSPYTCIKPRVDIGEIHRRERIRFLRFSLSWLTDGADKP